MTPLIKGMKSMAGSTWMLATVVLTWAFSAAGLWGQTWEYVYGTATGIEDGKFRVIPVTGTCATPGCCTQTDGYIAVGTAYPGQFDTWASDVHVVRTDNNGARIWEYTYDITGNSDWDYGWSIIKLSDGSGFVITGETQIGNNVDVFLLKIDCNGAVVWSRTYGGSVSDGGRDLAEAITGNAQFGTAAGDIIVAGYSLGPGPFATTPDGYLLRVRANGTLIWDAIYNYQPMLPPGDHEYFHSLTPLTGGDIIAVGFTANNGVPAAMQGLAVRVNGNTGAIGAAPQGAATYGLAGAVDQFWSVTELNPVMGVRDVAICGDYTGTSIYFIRLVAGNPNVPAQQLAISSATSTTALWGRTIRQVNFLPGMGSVAQGDLVLTGSEIPSGGTSDMILLSLAKAGGNYVLGGLAKTYGGTGNEHGWSVMPVPATGGRSFGFALCGDATSWGTGFGAQDMYLVKTDGFGVTGCEHALNVTSTPLTGSTSISMIVGSIGVNTPQSTVRTERQWESNVCTLVPLTGGGSPELGFNSFDQEMAK